MAAKKTGRKPAKKTAARKATKSRAPRKPARRKAPATGPKPVKTGSGATPLEVAQRLASLLAAGKAGEAEATLLAPGITSTEGVGASMTWTGKKAVLKKYRDWEADHEIHDMKVEGPWVGATGFAMRYWIDVTQKSTGQRSQMEEIAVYTVRNGKIAAEEFHFRTF